MKTSLKDAKDYIALKLNGSSKKEAALAVLGKNDPQTIKAIESSESYNILYNTMVNNQKLKVAQELHDIQLKTLKAKAELIEKGSELLSTAETLDDKIKAQENQRRNLDTSILSTAEDWAAPTRNQTEDNYLEGIIL